MIEGDYLYCIKDCIRYTYHFVVGEKFRIVKIQSSGKWTCYNISNDKRDALLSSNIASEYFESVNEHRKRLIEDLI